MGRDRIAVQKRDPLLSPPRWAHLHHPKNLPAALQIARDVLAGSDISGGATDNSSQGLAVRVCRSEHGGFLDHEAAAGLAVMNEYIPWLIVSANRAGFWRSIFRKVFSMFGFKKKQPRERTLSDFKSDLSTLVIEARKAGINWRSLSDALTNELDRLHQWYTLTAPIY